MLRAMWNGAVIAEAPATVELEGNYYFPPESLRREHLRESSHHTICPWKGRAHYYSVVVDGVANPDAAWYYPNPSPMARRIKDHVAFWHGVQVVGAPEPGADKPGLCARMMGRLRGGAEQAGTARQ